MKLYDLKAQNTVKAKANSSIKNKERLMFEVKSQTRYNSWKFLSKQKTKWL